MVQEVCKACGAELKPGKEYCPKCLVRVSNSTQETRLKKYYPKDTPENRAKKMKEYKVAVIEVEESFGTRSQYDSNRIEDTLNSFGLDGWSLKKILKRKVPHLTSDTYQLITILERDMPLEP
jgi:uncharacterized Zn finger protein (UPF0148 family)